MISLLSAGIPVAVAFAAALLAALTIHEAAHAATAQKLGDPTAARAGRVTLNPLRHLDPWGTLALIFVGFGWGKPVPVDPRNFRRRSRDETFVALAGIAANFLSALVAFAILKHFGGFGIPGFFEIFARISLVLAVFNLLPVGPLDGARLAEIFFEKIGRPGAIPGFLKWSGRALFAAIFVEILLHFSLIQNLLGVIFGAAPRYGPVSWILGPVVDALAAGFWLVS